MTPKTQKIEPIILRGTRDFLPIEMMRRNAVMAIMRTIFERFGYAPIETPIINPAETILGKYGDEGDRLTYAFMDNGGRRIALPYDLTVPFARFVATNYPNLPMPFKRYQIQRVWRAEKPQKGRLREFYQCDIDILGSKSLLGEAEVVKIISEVFAALRIPNITIKMNSRRLMNVILESCGVTQELILPAIRAIDKLAKVGEELVIVELSVLGIKDAETIIKMLKPEKTNQETLAKLLSYDMTEIQTFLGYCKVLGVPDGMIQLDPTLARGLDYYTGLTFEVISGDSDFGTICAGGRYDNLCGIFCDKDFSGIGVAFGFERIMLLLEKLDLLPKSISPSQAMVTLFDESSLKNSLAIYEVLISGNIAAEIYLDPKKLTKQFEFADKKQIPFVLIQGPEERAKDEVVVKRLATGKQKSLPISQMVSYLLNYHEAD